MRHLKRGRKFGRLRKGREALLKSLVFSLLTKGRIETTEAKAKELKPVVEKFITIGKKDGLAQKRLVSGRISPKINKKLFGEVSPLFSSRPGGYTRIIKLGQRQSDGAKMAIIELVK